MRGESSLTESRLSSLSMICLVGPRRVRESGEDGEVPFSRSVVVCTFRLRRTYYVIYILFVTLGTYPLQYPHKKMCGRSSRRALLSFNTSRDERDAVRETSARTRDVSLACARAGISAGLVRSSSPPRCVQPPIRLHCPLALETRTPSFLRCAFPRHGSLPHSYRQHVLPQPPAYASSIT